MKMDLKRIYFQMIAERLVIGNNKKTVQQPNQTKPVKTWNFNGNPLLQISERNKADFLLDSKMRRSVLKQTPSNQTKFKPKIF